MIDLAVSKLTPDTARFAVTGVTDPAAAGQCSLDFGDGSQIVLVAVDGAGAAVTTHTYTEPGHHVYTARLTASRTHAETLQDLSGSHATLQALASDARYPTLADVGRPTDTDTASVTVDVGRAQITATVQAPSVQYPLPWVLIDVVISSPGTVTLWSVSRIVGDDTVPIWVQKTSTGAVTIADREAPFGVPVYYRLDVTYSDIGTIPPLIAGPVLLDGVAGCWLSDPFSGAAMRIEVQSWDEREYDERRSVLGVIGRPDPVVISDVHLWASGEWVLLTRTDADTQAMLDILTASQMVQLRTQPGTSMRSVYASVGSISEKRYANDALDERRLTTVGIQEVAAIPAAARPLRSTLQGLSTAAATLEGLAALRPTLLSLSQMVVG